ncbi:MAG: hypothetical protein PVF47_00945 [Anaerolineae bacterium]|jgi:hypothetical protein
MKFSGTIPVVISALVGFLLGLVTVGLLRLRRSPIDSSLPENSDALLLGLLALAAFAMGAFLIYILWGLLL